MIEANTITADIIQLYEQYGNEDYDGEPVSQASHMIQCAMLGVEEGADDELIVGAFLHDIGHLLKHRQATDAMGAYGVINHEGIGAGFLQSSGFSERVCAVVKLHVQAKRFLVASDASYKNKLSNASIKTLAWQGGPMPEAEAEAFRLHPFFKDIVRVRLWDEKAKDASIQLLPLSYFSQLIRQHVK